MRCPNCDTEIADHLSVCWVCNSSLITLENFLNKKNKILVIIGVFGALSLYLLQTAGNNSDNFLLQLGSGISLLVMVVLSSIIITDCLRYIKRYPEIPKASKVVGYTEWIRHTINLLYLWAFLSGLCVIVSSVILFMLFYSKINETVLSVTFGFIFIFVIMAFIILPSDGLVRRGNFLLQLMIIAIFSFMVTLWGFYLGRDMMKPTQFSFLNDTIILCLFFFGWVNASKITVQNADRNWDYTSTIFTTLKKIQ
jgi:hypothetical protein